MKLFAHAGLHLIAIDMSLKIICLSGLLLSVPALAQNVYVEDLPNPIELHVRPNPQPLRPLQPAPVAEDLALRLRESLRSLENIRPQKCHDEASYLYALSLTVKGDYAACADYVETCQRQNGGNIPVSTAIQGARCARLEHQLQRAYDIFDDARNSSDFKGERAGALILEFAQLAQYTIFQDRTDAIIASHPFWTTEERQQARALVDFLGKNPAALPKAEIFAFVDRQIAGSGEFLNRLLKSYRVGLYLSEYQVQTAFDYLNQDVRSLVNPLDWWPQGFQILYRLAENADFTRAAALYRAFLPAANPRSYLPLEQNIYTYTQISRDACRGKMLQGHDLETLQADLKLWKQGQLPLNDLLNRLENRPGMGVQASDQSDLLSTYAGLLVIAGRSDLAHDYYWRAHRACPYNNRAHWGLLLLERKRKYASYPEFASNIRRLEDTIAQIGFPQEIGLYVMNWNSFPETSRDRIKYGARIWAPYMQQLNAANYRVYIKMPFELLSEAPGNEGLRDRRIGPPDMPSYKLDNRLWDDVRGAGGRNVIADHDETFETVQGDYNLLGHEVAHQFHAYLDNRKPALSVCIERLYNAAQARGVFPDPYAATNSREYFAQGVTYFLIPADAPARYGINVSWYPKNDPDLLRLIQSIQEAKGDLGRIRCPL